jgi:gliding motility-associated lipoprotein GldJ
MKNFVHAAKCIAYATSAAIFISSCSIIGGGGGNPDSSNPGAISTVTGLEFNQEGNFQVNEYLGQPDGPNLLFIEGGRTVLGSFEEDVVNSHDNVERAVTVASFYMDETEVSNINWLEYEYYIKMDSDEVYWKNNLPDTTVWARDLAYNDPYVSHYYRYPGFRFFPVVGVNWRQAVNYCTWRTQVVNNKLAEDSGYFGTDGEDSSDDVFAGAEDPTPVSSGPPQRIPLESGVILPNYRLPTEAEWEYAAQALIGTQWLDEQQTHRRLYPWDGHALRNPYGKSIGYMLANYKRGRGDYAGIAGKLNDGAMITTYIYDFPPNDFGLYNMAGNVSEWVQDVYRPLSFQDMDDMNPVRRDGVLDEESGYDAGYNFIGNEAPYASEDEAVAAGISPKMYNADNPPFKRMRVYKGGSWQDVAYWLSPGTRRSIFEDSATSAIGFRCAMIRADTNY